MYKINNVVKSNIENNNFSIQNKNCKLKNTTECCNGRVLRNIYGANNVSPDKLIGNFYTQYPNNIETSKTNFKGNQYTKLINNTQSILNKIDDSETKETFTNLYSNIIDNKSDVKDLSDDISYLAEKIAVVKDPEIKKIIIDEINTLNEMPKKSFNKKLPQTMVYAEELADSINTLDNTYVNLDGDCAKLYKHIKKEDSWLNNVWNNKKGSESDYGKIMPFSNFEISYDYYLKQFDRYSSKNIKQVFQNNLQMEGFRNFIEDHIEDKPEIVDYLHTKYLETLPQPIKEIYQDIKKDFGTLVISSNDDLNIDDAKYLQKELNLWKNTDKNKFIPPKYVDINILNYNLQKYNACGISKYPKYSIELKELLSGDSRNNTNTLRHEMNHLQDFKYDYEPHNFLSSLKNQIKWGLKKGMHKKEWEKELLNSGIKDIHLDYAFLNSCELKSVSMEEDISKFSNKYKDLLVNDFGLQKWILNLPQNEILIKKRQEHKS